MNAQPCRQATVDTSRAAPRRAGWRLTAAYGVADWVKNLRAAREATLTIRGRQVQVVATGFTPNEAAPLLKQILADARPTTWKLLAPTTTRPSTDQTNMEVEATRHPMFHLMPSEGLHGEQEACRIVAELVAGVERAPRLGR